jgi:hypothetical protein
MMHASFVDRYLELGKRFSLCEQHAEDMNSEQLLAIIGFLSQWAPAAPEVTLQHANDLPPANDGLLEG